MVICGVRYTVGWFVPTIRRPSSPISFDDPETSSTLMRHIWENFRGRPRQGKAD